MSKEHGTQYNARIDLFDYIALNVTYYIEKLIQRNIGRINFKFIFIIICHFGISFILSETKGGEFVFNQI